MKWSGNVKKSVIEYGAYGDGVHDDFAAVQAALDSGAEEIYIPQGIYCISDTLKVHSNTRITADKTAKIVMKCKTRRQRNDFLLSNSDTAGGNKNITIVGGIWDGNNTAPENAKPDIFDKNGYSGAVLNFVNVDGLKLQDMVIANSVTYYVRMAKLRNFEIENIDFVSDKFGHNQDGLHFGGDVKHGIVRNIRALSYGQTNDDMVALNADDSIERVENLDLVRDDIEDITIENIYTESCHSIIRMLSITAAIRNIRIKNVYGGFRCYAINADAARYCRTPLFKDEDMPNGVGIIENIEIENFRCFPVPNMDSSSGMTGGTTQTALMMETKVDNFIIKNFEQITRDDAPKDFSAMKMRNVADINVCADGVEYHIKEKSDVLDIGNFTDIVINKA